MNTTRSTARAAALVLAVWPAATAALTLDLPQGARLTAEDGSPAARYALPVAPWDGETVPTRAVEGALSLRAYRLDSGALTPLQVLRPLRDQLRAQGYELLFECADRQCGGFDFRFAIRVLPAPDMLVDLGNYLFLSARTPEDEAVGLLVSRSRGAVYVQVAHVAPEGVAQAEVATTAALPDSGPQGPLGANLEARGHVILRDLTFETGSSTLGPGPFASLDALAVYLDANPSRRVALVGHTDSVGSLEGNIALSKRRAGAVADRLVANHGVNRGQIDAEGMGYLAPIAPNLTPEGREANRRVEVVLISTE